MKSKPFLFSSHFTVISMPVEAQHWSSAPFCNVPGARPSLIEFLESDCADLRGWYVVRLLNSWFRLYLNNLDMRDLILLFPIFWFCSSFIFKMFPTNPAIVWPWDSMVEARNVKRRPRAFWRWLKRPAALGQRWQWWQLVDTLYNLSESVWVTLFGVRHGIQRTTNVMAPGNLEGLDVGTELVRLRRVSYTCMPQSRNLHLHSKT